MAPVPPRDAAPPPAGAAPAASAPASAPRPPAAPLSHGRFALYLAAAAALHAADYLLEVRGITYGDAPVLLHRPWASHAAFLVCMVVAHYAGGRARQLVLLASVAVVLGVLQLPVFVALLLFALVTFAISRLPLAVPWRAAAALAACVVVPSLRAGWWGPGGTRLLGTPSELDALVWGVLLLRALLYQVESARLEPRDRTFAAYLGSFTVIPLVGRGYLPPIPYAQLLGEHGTAPEERNLRRGLGLLTLGVAYQWVHVALALRYVHGPMTQFAVASAGHAVLPPSLTGATPGGAGLLLALVLYWPATYVHAAGQVFEGVGNLRLLGFNLASGFKYPLLSRNFVDLWKRWNHFYYDTLIVAYLPLLGWLRRRMSIAAAAVLAAVSVFLAETLARDLLTPSLGLVARALSSAPVWVPAARRLVVGAITVVTLSQLLRHRRAPAPTGFALLWRRALTVVVAATIVTAAQVLMLRLMFARP